MVVVVVAVAVAVAVVCGVMLICCVTTTCTLLFIPRGSFSYLNSAPLIQSTQPNHWQGIYLYANNAPDRLGYFLEGT